MPRFILTAGLLAILGCATKHPFATQLPSEPPLEAPVDGPKTAFAVEPAGPREAPPLQAVRAIRQQTPIEPAAPASSLLNEQSTQANVRPVGHVENEADQSRTTHAPVGTISIDGRRYQLQAIDPPAANQHVVTAQHSLASLRRNPSESPAVREVAPVPMPAEMEHHLPVAEDFSIGGMPLPANAVQMNLPSALAMIGGQHPVVGFAQWRVQEAYGQLAQAEVLWLPSIQAGFSFHRHDGNYQASDGTIVDINRNSFQYGLGDGATGAGTTPRPGLVAQFHVADAIFQPKIARKRAWAQSHAADATLNRQLLSVAQSYLDLVDAHQDVRILEETRQSTAQLSKLTHDFAETGAGLQADADRMKTELALTDNRLIVARGQTALASARLAQALSVNSAEQIVPLDVSAIPIDMVADGSDASALIQTGLAMRPELKESQALVAAACDAFQREKFAPFVPSVLLGYSTGGFGGGLSNNLSNIDGRYDFDAAVSWQVRNLGMGERGARRESSARVQQAKFEKLQVLDQVAREVSEAYSEVGFRRQQIDITQQAITTAQQSYQSNLDRIQDGEGLPIEVLQAVQALESARRAYLRAVIDHNKAQFQLQWALGWSVSPAAESMHSR